MIQVHQHLSMVTIIFQQSKGDKTMIYGNMKEHKYEVNGIKPQIMTEVTTLLHTLYTEGKFTKDDMYKMAELACMSEEDVHDNAMSQLDSLMSNVLDKVFEDAASGKQEAIDALDVITKMMLNNMRKKE